MGRHCVQHCIHRFSHIYLMQRYKLEKQLRKEEKNKKIIVSPMALTNLKETAENICNP